MAIPVKAYAPMKMSSTSAQDIDYLAAVLVQCELRADFFALPPIYQHPYRVMAESALKAIELRNSKDF